MTLLLLPDMGLLDKLKSTLGLESREERAEETTVTVEYEPDTESEAAVKGTDAPEDAGTGAGTDAGTDDAEAAGSEPQVEEPEAADAAAEAEAADAAAEVDESVETIQGIGPSYAERLREAGVETVGDLRGADVTDLAEETGLSEKRIERWVERAGE